MKRFTLSLPPELLRQIRLIASERGLSVSAVAREALEEMLASTEDASKPGMT